MEEVGFLSPFMNGPLPYVRRHITVLKNVLSVSLNKTFPSFHPDFKNQQDILWIE